MAPLPHTNIPPLPYKHSVLNCFMTSYPMQNLAVRQPDLYGQFSACYACNLTVESLPHLWSCVNNVTLTLPLLLKMKRSINKKLKKNSFSVFIFFQKIYSAVNNNILFALWKIYMITG